MKIYCIVNEKGKPIFASHPFKGLAFGLLGFETKKSAENWKNKISGLAKGVYGDCKIKTFNIIDK